MVAHVSNSKVIYHLQAKISTYVYCIAVINRNGLFAHIDTSQVWPGSEHDMTIYRHSAVWKHIQEGNFILGDKAYFRLDQDEMKILGPYKGPNLTSQQMSFNDAHSTERGLVERTFAKLRKWGMFQKGVVHRVKKLERIVPYFLVAANLVNFRKLHSHLNKPDFRDVSWSSYQEIAAKVTDGQVQITTRYDAKSLEPEEDEIEYLLSSELARYGWEELTKSRSKSQTKSRPKQKSKKESNLSPITHRVTPPKRKANRNK